MGIFTTALRNKKIGQILNKKYLTLLPQCIACHLTACNAEKNPSFPFLGLRLMSLGEVFFIDNLTYFSILKSGCNNCHTNSYNFAMTLVSPDLTAKAWAACG